MAPAGQGPAVEGAVEVVHATCIAVDGRGVLIRGPSGAGKSDLALRCLAQVPNSLILQPAALVADDRVHVTNTGGRLLARAPEVLRGRLEVRGQGVVALASVETVDIMLIADLVPAAVPVERLPDPIIYDRLCGVRLPVVRMHAFEASAAVKLLVALVTRYGQSAE